MARVCCTDRGQFSISTGVKIHPALTLLVDRHGKNDGLFDLYFANPDFQRMILAFMAGTYEEFRREAAS